jgi:hypothetical protein
MTISTREPARLPAIMSARLADLLRRALPRWLLAGKPAVAAQAAQEADADASNVEHSGAGNSDAALPWWTNHHPALSFRHGRAGPSDREQA